MSRLYQKDDILQVVSSLLPNPFQTEKKKIVRVLASEIWHKRIGGF